MEIASGKLLTLPVDKTTIEALPADKDLEEESSSPCIDNFFSTKKNKQ